MAVIEVAELDPKKRVLLVSTHPVQTTGYSKVSLNLLKHLGKREDLEIVQYGFQNFNSMDSEDRLKQIPSNVLVYDAAKALSKPDVIVIFNDSMIVSKFLIELKKEPRILSDKVRIVVYLDQVYPTQRVDLLSIIVESAHHIITFTDYWKQELLKQNVRVPMTALMHGFDDETFKPLDLPKPRESTMLVLNLNRNQPRKRLDIMAMAMAQVFIKRPDANVTFVIGSDARTGAWDVPFIFQVELSRVFPQDQVQYYMNKVLTPNNGGKMTDSEVNELYNQTDVGINTCCGEGVGLNQLEHAGVGKPQIAPALGGLTDFLNAKNSILIEPKYRLWAVNAVEVMGGEQRLVDPSDVSDAILKYHDDPKLREKHGAQARKDMLNLKWADVASELYDLLLSL
ncbi:hypothetical protein KFL_008380055 [Klebsormidium nitens]|uniref:Glycosyl transferase family 1 domain-containing protein n=1 Tax=Klebsormidium nitens TaxID=105231 RepID=A0A1Y1ILP7_KLENI|nr:hypothetical protein KFL_008380055 [Klebsormidium nitens]|eukprot:GAQ91714.1 hypothetical protein KFL_008380055 [Klebsormidium nitens]